MRITILGTGSVASRLGALLAQSGQSVVWASRSPTAPRTSLPSAATVVPLTGSGVNAEVLVVAVPWLAADGSSAIDCLPTTRIAGRRQLGLPVDDN
jgi:predicted dinucleotide-binding enzyme